MTTAQGIVALTFLRLRLLRAGRALAAAAALGLDLVLIYKKMSRLLPAACMPALAAGVGSLQPLHGALGRRMAPQPRIVGIPVQRADDGPQSDDVRPDSLSCRCALV